MNMKVTAKNTVTMITVAVIAALVVILILIATRRISLPFISSYIRDQLESHFQSFNIDFDSLHTQWHPLNGVINFHLGTVRAVDYDNNNLAAAPKMIIEVKANSVLKNIKKINTVVIHNPKISLIRSIGGALKFDIGNTHDDSSRRVLETILLNAHTTSSKTDQDTDSPINFRIVNSDLTLSDEISGSLLRVPNAYIDLIPQNNEVNCNYKFNVFASGEYLNILGNCSYNTDNKHFNLSVNLDEVRPALLTEFFPQFMYFKPLEVQLSGKVQLEFDNLLHVTNAEFDLTSEKGTLEVIETLGKNLEINSLYISGKALNEFSHISLDELKLDLNDNYIIANALFLKDKNILDIKLNAFVKGSSIEDILPRWFAYLETEDLDCLKNNDDSYRHSSFSIDGTYDLTQQKINALGQFKCHEVLLSSKLKVITVEDYLNSTTKHDLNFRIDGALDAPNLATAY